MRSPVDKPPEGRLVRYSRDGEPVRSSRTFRSRSSPSGIRRVFPGENQFQVRHFVYDAAKGFNQTQMIFVRPELGRIKQEFWRELQPEASGLEISVTLLRPELPLRRSRHHDDALLGKGK